MQNSEHPQMVYKSSEVGVGTWDCDITRIIFKKSNKHIAVQTFT